jgi:hypothetical protein
MSLWREKLRDYPNIRVSNLLEREAGKNGLLDNADLADWIIPKYATTAGSIDSSDSPESVESPESTELWRAILENPNVKQLVEEFDLEMVGVSKVMNL